MISRNDMRERLFDIRLAPSTLAVLWGGFPTVLCDFLNEKRKLSSETLSHIEGTLSDCEALQASTAIPIRWSDVARVKPLLRKIREEREAKAIRETELRELRKLSVRTKETTEEDDLPDIAELRGSEDCGCSCA